ncbi:MAG: mandelate racemase/muconate lactonizing protein [Anaerolineae bacterium]|nr:mandelate racemase/muconate lactonizing protein [Anaerolineae bacterium]
MKITAVRLFEVRGTMAFPGTFWEERLIRPMDIYPEHKTQGAGWLAPADEGHYAMRSQFCQIETDEEVSGLGGPTTMEQAYIIQTQIAPMLIGHDPLATERIWDRVYRSMVHGRKGAAMMALSVVDCALWDLKGKWAGAPVYRLLGGPTRETIPAYASALGYSLEPDKVRQRVQEMVAQGYKATKWFFREGPTDGVEGIAKNVELVRTLREAAGPDMEIMLDCWMSWDVPYTIQMADRLAEYRPRWLEEPVLPDKIAQYAEIRRSVRTPIAGGEHEYTRWGLKALMDAEAVDVLQPDIYWAGGISEMQKIAALASAYDLPLIPHGHSTPATAHFIASQPVTTCPIIEYLVKWNEIHQFFLKNPLKPVNGVVHLPATPGIGMQLDEAKIEERIEILF